MWGPQVLPQVVSGGAGVLPRLRHKDRANVVLMDGHAEAFGESTFTVEGIKAGEPDLFEFKIEEFADFWFK
jgi:prepilin-type processing-associated H-X9-DG protein